MMWNIFNLLVLVLLMYCVPTVESKECDTIETDVGVHGMELDLNFLISNLRDKYKTYLTELYGNEIKQDEIHIQDLRKELVIWFKNKMDSMKEYIIYKNGNPTGLAGNLTEIFLTNDNFVVKKTKLQKEDAGIYWIEFRSIRLEQKALIIADKPKITRRSPPNPVLKPEDNYISIIQLECHSVSTSIGECPLSIYTVWYKNGMKMIDLDPTLSQINVNVDRNGGNFTCLATDYPPCYQRLQTTKHYDVANIEECNEVSESETFIVQPEYKPNVNKNEDLKVSCSANCHPICEVKWEKEYQGIKSTSFITETLVQKDLELANIYKSHEGVYVCLVKNIHGEVEKKFTLSVRVTGDNKQNDDVYLLVVFIIVIVIVVMVMVFMIYKRHMRRKKGKKKMLESLEEEGLKDIFIQMEEWTRKLLESIEMIEKKMMEEGNKTMLESIEERELKKIEEVKMLESIEERESMTMEEEKKMLGSLEERDLKKMKKWKNRLESIEEKELIKKMKEVKKKTMEESLEEKALKMKEEVNRELSESFEKKKLKKMKKGKKKMLENIEEGEPLMMKEVNRELSESFEKKKLKKMEEEKMMMLEIIEEKELIKKMKEVEPFLGWRVQR